MTFNIFSNFLTKVLINCILKTNPYEITPFKELLIGETLYLLHYFVIALKYLIYSL